SPGSGLPEGSPAEYAAALWDFEGRGAPAWELRLHQGQARGAVFPGAARTGGFGFAIDTGPGGADADAQVHVRVRPSTDYVLEGHLRARGLVSAGATVCGAFFIGEFDYARSDNLDWNDPVVWHRDLPSATDSPGEWVPVRYEFRTGATTRMLRIAASLGNWGFARGGLDFDDVRLLEVAHSSAAASRTGGDATLSGAASPDRALRITHVTLAGETRRCLGARADSEFEVRLRVPERAELRFGIGVEEPGWTVPGDGTRFEVLVGAGSAVHGVYSRHLHPAGSNSDRGWRDGAISLAPWEGREISIQLRTRASRPGAPLRDAAGDLGVWSNPRVVVPRSPSEEAGRPDVVLITIDTLRPDHLGCYGYERPTSPAMDRLAAEGVLFENVYTTVPRTSPAVASLMTGLYPRAHGLTTLLDSLAVRHQTLAERLAEAGYSTGAVVTNNVALRTGLGQGFHTFIDHADVWVNDPRTRAEHLAAEAAEWLAAHGQEPLFLWLHLWDPHFRYLPPSPHDRWFAPGRRTPFDLYQRIDRGELTLGELYFQGDLSPAELQRAIDLYDGEIRYTDGVLGRFLDYLDDAGILENAWVVLTSDHGESLGEQGYFFEHGEYLYDSTLRIPLVIRAPGGAGGGRRVSRSVSILDVVPTVLGAVGLSAPVGPGMDLLAGDGGDVPPREALFGETGRRFFPENPRRPVSGTAGNWLAVVSGGWKLIRVPTPGGAMRELYDLRRDPGETRNLFDAHDPRAQQLEEKLDAWVASFEGGGEAEAVIDPESAARLRALGYLD
ncbi:MAG: sulfatase-like hydrolase/transferase, partial [Planctomycetota bacterium]|nr:sulfatase-like hydrolase/transferase [Planctomycetota bacterium]